MFEGTVHDRFGIPVVGERVYLLSADQVHPSANTPLPGYVTALTGETGRFSLTFRDEGPRRLAIGPPGQPRIPPTELHSFTSTTRAEAIVPGPAAGRVSFDRVEEELGAVTLEFLALNDPTAPHANRRSGRGELGGRSLMGSLNALRGTAIIHSRVRSC